MGKIIRIDGSEQSFFPANKQFSLEELQAAVDGYIEVLTLPSGQLLVLDKEGKLKQKLANRRATLLGRAAGIGPLDTIVGDVVVCEPEEFA